MTAEDVHGVPGVEEDRAPDAGALVEGAPPSRFDAFAALYERHGTEVYALARRLCGRDADEVVRRVFLSVWHSPNAYDLDGGTMAGQLSALTFAACAGQLEQTAAPPSGALREHDPSPRPELADRVGRTAWDALDTLPTALRDAIALAHLSGYTYGEIADRLAQIDIDAAQRSGTMPARGGRTRRR